MINFYHIFLILSVLFGFESDSLISFSTSNTNQIEYKFHPRFAEKVFQNQLANIAKSEVESELYISADQRHQGLSRFDLIPFTDRKKGDPDRYRAVNPRYVKRVNGNYYFALELKSGAHYFDDNLNDKGILLDKNVDVDLTRTRSFKAGSGGGETVKYFFAKDKGFVLSESLAQTAGEIRAGRWFFFSLKSGKHELYDGTGVRRGTIVNNSIKLNYGLEKIIKGEKFYYAFSTKISFGKSVVGASGWVKAAAIATGSDPQFDVAFVQKMQMPTASNDKFAKYEITGGNPLEIVGKDENGGIKYKFGYVEKNGDFVAYKVLPKIPLTGKQNVAATDYLKRSDDVINLGFNVAGVSNDTFRIKSGNRPLIFYRSSEKDATAVIDLFYPKDETHDGEEIIAQMTFVYGYVAVGTEKRWGWIPLDAVKLSIKNHSQNNLR